MSSNKRTKGRHFANSSSGISFPWAKILGPLLGTAIVFLAIVTLWPTAQSETDSILETAIVEQAEAVEVSDGESSETSDATVAVVTGTAALTEDVAEVPKGSVTVAAVGDIIFASYAGEQIKRNGIDYPFAETKEKLSESDIVIANFEGTLSDRGVAAEKEYLFRSSPDWAEVLSRGGVTIANLANNHIYDYGADALTDTLSALNSVGLDTVGAGKDHEAASTPTIVEANGTRIAMIAFTDVVPLDFAAGDSKAGAHKAVGPDHVAEHVEYALHVADEVVVSFHWGEELATEPNSRQRNLAKAAVDAGAALIIGHHSHVIQPVEQMGRAIVAYSLGNFVHTPPSELASQSGILTATITPGQDTTAELLDAVIVNGQPRLK